MCVCVCVCACVCACVSGRSWQDKVGDVRREMEKKGVIALAVTSMDEIACELNVSKISLQDIKIFPAGLYNLRGSDIDYNPLFFSYALITMDYVK